MGSHGKIVMVRGKSNAWDGSAGGYSLSAIAPPSISTDKGTDKGYGDIWVLHLQDITWKHRVKSLYAPICAGNVEAWDIRAVPRLPGTPATAFRNGCVGLSGIGLLSAADGHLYPLGGNINVFEKATVDYNEEGGVPMDIFTDKNMLYEACANETCSSAWSPLALNNHDNLLSSIVLYLAALLCIAYAAQNAIVPKHKRPSRGVVLFCTDALLLLSFIVSVDAAKNRGWLMESQLVRGSRPRPRTGYGIAIIPDLCVIFGGNAQGSPSNDVHVLNSKTRTWSELTGALGGPRPSIRHSMGFSIGINFNIYMFGGVGMAGTFPKQVIACLSSFVPLSCYVTYLAPGPQNHQNDLVSCLKLIRSHHQQDLWKLDLTNLQWAQIFAKGSFPSARHSMGFVKTTEGNILVFGGQNGAGVALDDLFVLDTVTEQWNMLNPAGDKPSARYSMGFAMASHGKVILVGGKLNAWTGNAGEYSWAIFAPPTLNVDYSTDKGNDDIWELDLVQVKWKRRVATLFAIVCAGKNPVMGGTAAATFCGDYIGLHGVGLTTASDGLLYLIGGNIVVESVQTGIDFSEFDGPDGIPTDTDCIVPEPEPTWHYANFLKFDPSLEEMVPQTITGTAAAATLICADTDVACRQYFGPQPYRVSSVFAVASDPESGMMLLLHPDTGDWWQYNAQTPGATKWVRNNGNIEGRTVSSTPSPSTSFFAATYVEASGKYIVIGGGSQVGPSWSEPEPPGPLMSPFSLTVEGFSNFMELDLMSGRWTDIDSLMVKQVLQGLACTDEDKCVPPLSERLFSSSFCEYSDLQQLNGVCVPCGQGKYVSGKYVDPPTCQEIYPNDPKNKKSCLQACELPPSGFAGSYPWWFEGNPTLRYGHGVAVGPAGDLVLFGGTTGNLDHAAGPLPKKGKSMDCEFPPCNIDNRELISGTFAGVLNAKNDLWFHSSSLLGQNNGEWAQIQVGLKRPLARSFFGFVALPNRDNTFLLFGGFTVKRLPELRDTWKLTITQAYAVAGYTYTGTWTNIELSGPSPSGRMGIGLTANNADGNIHLFGGGVFDWAQIDAGTQTLLTHAAVPRNDGVHWIFDPDQNEWTLMDASTKEMPKARCFPGFETGRGPRANSLFLFGGSDEHGNVLNDLWEYKVNTAVWSEISAVLTGQPPSPRFGMGMFCTKVGDLYIVGGQGPVEGFVDFYKVPLPRDDVTLPQTRYEFLQIYDEDTIIGNDAIDKSVHAMGLTGIITLCKPMDAPIYPCTIKLQGQATQWRSMMKCDKNQGANISKVRLPTRLDTSLKTNQI